MSQMQLLDVSIDRAERRDHDFYETPVWMTRALMKRIPIAGKVLEPCAGRGAICRVLVAAGAKVFINEPYQQYGWTTAEGVKGFAYDACEPALWTCFPAVDWVVTNPPFNLAEQIVPLAYKHARLGVVMLLRLSWLEPTDGRASFLEQHPPALIGLPRHDFRGDGATDSVTSAWFVWLCDEGARRFGSFRNSIVTKRERDELIAAELQR